MKTLKNLTILIAILSSVLFYVSCADKTTMEITLSYYAGDWYQEGTETLALTIKTDGSIIDNNNKSIPASDITRNSATSYTTKEGSTLNFNSATQGTFTIQGNDEPTKITKK